MITPHDRVSALNIWRNAEPYIQRALDHSAGEFDSLDILRALLGAEMMLWTYHDEHSLKGIAVTQWINYPRLSCVRIVLLAGDNAVDDWFVDMMNEIESWARRYGAKRIEEVGRPGWERLERKLNLGFKKSYVTMHKDL